MTAELQQLPSIIRDNLPRLYAICRKHYVKRLWVFGSVVRDDFRPDSDIDILYEFDLEQMPDKEYLGHFWGIWDDLELIFGRKVDFVHYPSLKNPYLKAAIDQSKVLIYEKERTQVSQGHL